MTFNNSLRYILSLPDTSVGGIERLRAVCAALDQPQRQLREIHICGDAGKNSSAEMLSSILTDSGFSVGIYSLSCAGDVRERIKVNGKPISHTEFAEAVKRIIEALEEASPDSSLSKEEALLLISLIHFDKMGCEIALFERRLSPNDSSLLNPPMLSVITSVFDNASKTLFEDAIHRGTRETVTCIQHKDIYNAISDACAAVGCRLTLPIYGEVQVKKISLFKTVFFYRGIEYSIGTFSPCQILNAITVIEAAHALRRVGVNIAEDNIVKGISKARFPLKCEVVSVAPTIIAASVVNEKQLEALTASLAQIKDNLSSRISVFSFPESSPLANELPHRLGSCEISVTNISLLENVSSPLFAKQIKDIIAPIMQTESTSEPLLFIGDSRCILETVKNIRKNLGNI